MSCSPSTSTDELYIGEMMDDCLTTWINQTDDALEGKAPSNHGHSGYAPTSHEHTGYAAADHSHNGFAATEHTHSTSDVTGLETALEGKAAADHSHTGYANADHSHTGFAAENHTHTGFATEGHTHGEFNTLANAIDGKAAANHGHTGYSAEGHTHTGFASENHSHSEYAAATHTHNGYAATNHTHTGFADENHGHSAADVTGLAAAIQKLLEEGSISMVKKVQRGVIVIEANAFNGTATIEAVNPEKAFVVFGGFNSYQPTSENDIPSLNTARLDLTNATTVTARRAVAPTTTAQQYKITVPFQVVEY